MKKIICIFLSLSMIFMFPLCVNAYDMEINEENVKAKSVILMDMDSREVLYSKDELLELSPASVTKIMSLLLILEALDSGKIKLDDDVTASKDSVAMGGSQIWLEVGETMTVNELLKAVIVASANDACTALGEYVGGSSVGFVKMMNDRAGELGLMHTNFENCTGLDDTTKSHYSCAYDLAVISSEVMKYEIVKEYSTIWLDSLRNGETELNNTNKLVNSYEGITGLKTGTTSNAGFCVSATATRENLNLVAVVLGADTSENRFDTAAYLLDMGFANFKSFIPEFDEDKIDCVQILCGKEKSVKPIIEANERLLLPKNIDDIEYSYVVEKSIKAPIKFGDKLGYIEIKSNGDVVKTVNLISPMNVEKATYSFVFWRLFRNI